MKQYDERGSNLIFLIAPPGSGAALLQRLLRNHPNVHSLPDAWIMLHPLYALKHCGPETDYEALRARSALDSFLSQLPGGERDYIAALRAMASVLYERALSISGKSIFLDNTPRYYQVLPELRRVFPKARFVFLLRNPLAVLSSTIAATPAGSVARFRETSEYADLINAPRHIADALQAWGQEAAIVRYEQLFTAPQDTLKALCSQLGLAYDPAMTVMESAGSLGSEVEDRSLSETPVRWTADFAEPAWRSFAEDYLQSLGEPLITGFGYRYSELQASLRGEVSAIAAVAPENSTADLNEEGERLFACGDVDAAMERFQAALRLDGRDPLTLNNVAVAYWQRGNLPEALGTLAQGMEIAPDNRELVTNGVHILCAAERPGDALALCRSYLQEYPRDDAVRQIMESIAVQFEDSLSPLPVAGLVEDELGDIDANPAQELNRAGEVHFAAGNLSAAQQAFEQALAADPRDVDVLNNLGVVCWHQGETGPALNYLSQALELQSDHRDAILNCASICNTLGHSQESRILCEAYLRQHPDDEQIRALLRDSGENVAQAELSVEQLNAEGERLFGEGDIEGAKALFLEACALDPANGTTCNNLGVLFWHSAHPDEALLYLGRAMDAEPDNPVFVNNSIRVLIDAGRAQDAMSLSASFIRDHPEHAESMAVADSHRACGIG